jgi:glycosyltransferase involved in cell wall biosynthesis
MYDLIIKTFKNYKEDIEIIFVNDGSKDKTIDNLRKIIKDTKYDVKVIDFSRNFGKESAIYAGLTNSKGDYVALIDGDLQQDPKYVLDAVEFLKKNTDYDCVTYYQEKRKENFLLSFIKKSFYRVINMLSETKLVQDASDFRVLKRNMVEAILSIEEYYRFSIGIFAFVGFKNKTLPYEVKERNSGKSKWGIIKLFKYAFEGILSFTTKPLKLSYYAGILSLLSFLVYLIVLIVTSSFNIDTITILLILSIGGLILLSIGILGEYIGRTYIENKNRPVYFTREIIKSRNE